MSRKLLWSSFLILLVGVMLSSPVYAHKVMVFAYQEGGRVFLEGYFSDGKAAQNSQVEVFGEDGSKLMEGTTDDKGAFSFPVPDVPGLRIVLTASMGHRAECTVKINPDAVTSDTSKSTLSGDVIETVSQDKNSTMTALGEDRIRAIVAEELDKKIAPLVREVALLNQEKPSLPDIIGGIGYIAGIMGFFMYFKVRRKIDN